MRIAIISSRFPYPLERGDKLRLFHQIKALSLKHEIFLFAVNDLSPSEKHVLELQKYCSKVTVLQNNLWQKMTGLFYAWIKGWPLQAGLNFSSKFEDTIIREIEHLGIDVVYCQLIRMAPYCRKIRHRKVLDYMDALGLGMEKRAALVHLPLKWIYLWEAARVRRYEKQQAQQFDGLTAITSLDAAALDLPAKSAPLAVVANGIDTNYFGPTQTSEVAYDIGFVGNLGYLPNVGAVKYLTAEIATVYKTIYGKQLKILLSGARPSSEVKSLASSHIDVRSWVDDIRSSYWSMKILVAPIFFGTGQQNKILEAMACGIPVICSPDVAMGVNARHQIELLVAQNAEQFAHAIHQLLNDQDLSKTLCDRARQFVESNYDWDKNTEILCKLLNTKDIV